MELSEKIVLGVIVVFGLLLTAGLEPDGLQKEVLVKLPPKPEIEIYEESQFEHYVRVYPDKIRFEKHEAGFTVYQASVIED